MGDAYRGSQPANSALILSTLPSVVHDSSPSLSGCTNTILNSFLARCKGKIRKVLIFEKEWFHTMLYVIIWHRGPIQPTISASSTNDRRVGSCRSLSVG